MSFVQFSHNLNLGLCCEQITRRHNWPRSGRTPGQEDPSKGWLD